LLENDFQRRLNYSQWFLGQCQEEQFLQNLIIGDEATFCINSYVNTRNTREYAPKGQALRFVEMARYLCLTLPTYFDVNISR